MKVIKHLYLLVFIICCSINNQHLIIKNRSNERIQILKDLKLLYPNSATPSCIFSIYTSLNKEDLLEIINNKYNYENLKNKIYISYIFMNNEIKYYAQFDKKKKHNIKKYIYTHFENENDEIIKFTSNYVQLNTKKYLYAIKFSHERDLVIVKFIDNNAKVIFRKKADKEFQIIDLDDFFKFHYDEIIK